MAVVDSFCSIIHSIITLKIEMIEVTHSDSTYREYIPNGLFECSSDMNTGHCNADKCPVFLKYERKYNHSEDDSLLD